MKNIVLMKNSTIKSGSFTRILREIMAETKEKAKGLWYGAGAKYSSMPTFKLKMSKNPMLKSLGNISERYGARIIAGTALAAIGVGGIELLMHPEIALAADEVDLSDNTETIDGNTIEGTVTNVEDTVSENTNTDDLPKETTHFAADPNAEKSDDFVDYSDVDYHAGKDGNPILDYHYDDGGNVVIDASDEEIAEKMQEFKDGNTEPETTPETEPETTPETEPETTPETEPKTTPHTEPDTTPDKPEPDKPTPDKPEEPEKPNIPVNDVPQTGDDLLNKAFGLTGVAITALAVMENIKNRMFKTDKVASSAMRLGVAQVSNAKPTYRNIK